MSKVIRLADIKEGMILADNVSAARKLLLAKGTVIKPTYINLLRKYGVSKVTVCEQEVKYQEITDNPIGRFYESVYRDVEKISVNMRDGEKVSAAEVIPIVEEVLEIIFANKENVLLLTGYKTMFDTYHYAHSMDVCIYSLIAAKAMGLSYEDIITLGIGALLHDIGKCKVPEHILNKKGRLTKEEFEMVKKHPTFGLQILGNISQMNSRVARIIMEHHERCDGSGYPRHLKGEEIDQLSKIVAVADIYDALTSDRIYKKKILPHEAAEYLLAISCSELDASITKVFLENIAIYPKGCQVLLSTNEVAVVTNSNKIMPIRPTVKLLTDTDRNPLLAPYEMDLSENLSTFITHIFN